MPADRFTHAHLSEILLLSGLPHSLLWGPLTFLSLLLDPFHVLCFKASECHLLSQLGQFHSIKCHLDVDFPIYTFRQDHSPEQTPVSNCQVELSTEIKHLKLNCPNWALPFPQTCFSLQSSPLSERQLHFSRCLDQKSWHWLPSSTP